MSKFSRRDFLKVGWNILGSGVASKFLSNSVRTKTTKDLPNIIVFVCDAMTASNLSLYGYERKTTPKLEILAERALVYHNHYSNGSFTVPGTASLFTGLKPWTHRAINSAGIITGKENIAHNIFRLLGEDYFKLAFSQNYWAANLIHQFLPDIDSILPSSEFGLINAGEVYEPFKGDPVISSHALEDIFYYRNSLLLSFLFGLYYDRSVKSVSSNDYPLGFPVAQFYDNVFTLKDLFKGIRSTIFDLNQKEQSFFTYFHIFPPHDPYNPHKDFVGRFDRDGYVPVSKDEHTLSAGNSQESMNSDRSRYDSFIANIDMELGNLLEGLQKQGILDNTYFILTSDHGEMFERGIFGHFTPMLYDSIIHIPLIIFSPNNKKRQDFITSTSNIDLLPTILKIAGKEIPTTCEGNILPGLGGIEDTNRAVISMDAKESSAHKPFTKATYTIIKGHYKLIYYNGYNHKYKDYFEFYDLQEDPEELSDKYSKPKFASIIDELKQELLSSIETANRKLAD